MRAEGAKPTKQERARLNARNLEILNRAADELNAEAADVLDYQSLEIFDADPEEFLA